MARMVTVTFDASDADRIAAEFEIIGDKGLDAFKKDTKGATRRITSQWRDNARATARQHGKHYPGTIIPELVGGGLGAVIGPISAMPQGGMGRGFEYGSRNQPPHLDMTRTVDNEFPKYIAALNKSIQEVVR